MLRRSFSWTLIVVALTVMLSSLAIAQGRPVARPAPKPKPKDDKPSDKPSDKPKPSPSPSKKKKP